MTIKNTLSEYGSVTKFFHWGIFIIFVCMFIIAEIMMDMDKGPDKWQLYGLHKSTGLIVFFIILARILWKLVNIAPVLPNTMNSKQKMIAHTMHFILYICMLALPISGYVMSMAGDYGISFYGLFDVVNVLPINKQLADIAHEIHEIAATAIYILIPLHIAAAVYHHRVLKDNLLTRMMPKRKDS